VGVATFPVAMPAHANKMRKRHHRPPREIWAQLRRQVWERDGGCCVRCGATLLIDVAHIDHRIPLSRGGTNALDNLRTLCRRCHVLRADHAHQGMIAQALRDGVIPPRWRELVWDESDTLPD
jgi:5-methylcytosine-specific restriction endonuclease McrA